MAKKPLTRSRKIVKEESLLPQADTRPNFSSAKALNVFKKVSITQLLVLLLVVASFLIGVLFTKVQYLEKNQTAGTAVNAPAQGTQQAQQPGLTDGQKVTIGNGHFPALGKDDAKVTIVEFADFRCPFCENLFTQTEPQIIKDYIDTGKAKLYFRQFAFLGDASVVAANAAECANEQGKFWDYYNYLYKNQPSESDTSMYNTDTLTQSAVNLGMNGDQFRSCLSSKKYDANVTKDQTEGQAAGVSGTPTIFINGIAVVGAQPYSAFKTIIDQELAKAK